MTIVDFGKRKHISINIYRQNSNPSLTLVDNKIVYHWDVIWSNEHNIFIPDLTHFNRLGKDTARRDEEHLSFGNWCALWYHRFGGTIIFRFQASQVQ